MWHFSNFMLVCCTGQVHCISGTGASPIYMLVDPGIVELQTVVHLAMNEWGKDLVFGNGLLRRPGGV